MSKYKLQLNDKAIAEANAVAAPFLEVHRKACVAVENSASEYREVWHCAYADALKAPRNQE